ncbi:DUF4391 domain-containing protein [Comamonas fluminis]|uniref:DUF4391 domain-containing protein n=1 Tax=Comamonas fluminis TaxID=2796366 RepID=UPI001C471EB7|nr:DUF4391 domain-containing protein [Comamonas fluminis]
MSTHSLQVQQLLAALAVPATALVQKRIPKKMLAESGAATVADRKLVQDHIEELTWYAALKPGNVGVAAYEDEQRNYLEVAVLVAQLRSDPAPHVAVTAQQSACPVTISTSIKRVAELVHRAIPYPTLLVLDSGGQLLASMAHIRKAQRELDKTVLDDAPTITALGVGAAAEAFLQAMALDKQPTQHLQALYQGWIDTLSAWQAVELIGQFIPSHSPQHAEQRRAALNACRDLDTRIAAARAAAAKEKQLARQVAANLEIKALLAQRQQAAQNL